MRLWARTAVFAVDMEGPADPADGPLEGLGRFEDLRMVALDLPAADAAMFATAKAMFEWRRRHRHCANCGQPSQPMDGGWKRFCPSCKVERDPVVIMLAVRGSTWRAQPANGAFYGQLTSRWMAAGSRLCPSRKLEHFPAPTRW